MEKKIAVIFPGVGYHVDKPLLYYSRKLAGQYGYEIVCADYGKLPSGIKGDMKKMYEAYEQALANVTEKFADLDFHSYDRVLFISKSIGTAVAASMMPNMKLAPDISIILRWKLLSRQSAQRGSSFTGPVMTGLRRKLFCRM